MIRTGIYGGSFNPIHVGHIALAEWLCQHGELDELWFLVSPQNPLKATASDLLDENKRIELARLAVKDNPKLKVSDFEFHLPRPSYMVHTLEALREAFPEHEFSLVIGADNWYVFHQWKAPEQIMQHHRILIYPRKGYEVDPTSLPSNVFMVSTPLFNVSSTEIRQRIANGLDASTLLSPIVWQEIQRKGYYK